MVFANKSKSINIAGDVSVAEVESYTHGNKNQIVLSKQYFRGDDHVAISIDRMELLKLVDAMDAEIGK